MKVDKCPICSDWMRFPVVSEEKKRVLDCTHTFHEACIKAWSEKHESCPSCLLGKAHNLEEVEQNMLEVKYSMIPDRLEGEGEKGKYQETPFTETVDLSAPFRRQESSINAGLEAEEEDEIQKLFSGLSILENGVALRDRDVMLHFNLTPDTLSTRPYDLTPMDLPVPVIPLRSNGECFDYGRLRGEIL